MWPSAPSGGLRQRLVVLRLLPVLPVSVHCRLLVVSMLEVRWSSGLGTWPSATSGRLCQCIAVFSALGGLRQRLVGFRASVVCGGWGVWGCLLSGRGSSFVSVWCSGAFCLGRTISLSSGRRACHLLVVGAVSSCFQHWSYCSLVLPWDGALVCAQLGLLCWRGPGCGAYPGEGFVCLVRSVRGGLWQRFYQS